jgi:hypothetical protein
MKTGPDISKKQKKIRGDTIQKSIFSMQQKLRSSGFKGRSK